MSLTYEQFTLGNEITNDIEDIRNMRNIGYYDGKYWWAKTAIVTLDAYVYIYSAPDFTTAKTLVHSYNITAPTTMNYVDTPVLRIRGDNIAVSLSCEYNNGAASIVRVDSIWSTDGGATWTEEVQLNVGGTGGDPYVLDFIFEGSNIYMLWSLDVLGSARVYASDCGTAGQDDFRLTTELDVYAGYHDQDNDDYRLVVKDYSDDLWYILPFSSGTFDTGVLLGTITEPTIKDVAYHQYWKQEGTEMLMDREYFRTRAAAVTTWAEYEASSATLSICLIWSFDNWEINYIVWGAYIWEWTEGGAIERLMVFDDTSYDAYVGYGDWFCDGTYKWGVDLTTTFSVNSGELLKQSLQPDRLSNLFSSIEPFTNQFLKLYLSGVLFYMGRVERDKNDFTQYEYIMKSGPTEDYDVKITESFTAQTMDTIIRTVIDNNFEHIWHGRGTNANVNTFTANQIDGTDTDWTNLDDNANTVSSLVEQKTFYNSHSLKNEVFTNILQQDDQDINGNCQVRLDNQTFLIFSIWAGSSDVTTQNMNIAFEEGSTSIGQISITASQLKWYDGAFHNLQAATNNYLYHIACVFSSADDDVDIYINGVFNSTQSLVNNITTSITKIDFLSSRTVLGFSWYIDFYMGDSLADAMNTLSSISPLNTDTFTKDFTGTGFRQVLKWAARYGGYVASFTPNYQLYLGSNNVSGQDVNENGVADSYGYRERKLEELREKFSLVRAYGGYVDGEQLEWVVQGEPNQGYWQDTFANVTDLDELKAIVAQLIADKNVEIVVLDFYLTGKPIFRPGTSFTFTSARRSYTAEVFNVTRVSYDILTGEQGVYSADSYWLPDAIKPEDQRMENAEDRIDQTEQHIGSANTQIDILIKAMPLGSANAFPIICPPHNFSDAASTFTFYAIFGRYNSVSAADGWASFTVPLPTNKAGKKLYISQVAYDLFTLTGANDYVDTVRILGHNYAAGSNGTTIDENTTNQTTVGNKTDNFGGSPLDCSSYDYITVNILMRAGGADNFIGGYPMVTHYYDT